MRDIRNQRGLTQHELAELVGVRGGTISRWERDLTHPHGEVLLALSQALAISVDALLKGAPS